MFTASIGVAEFFPKHTTPSNCDWEKGKGTSHSPPLGHTRAESCRAGPSIPGSPIRAGAAGRATKDPPKLATATILIGG